MGFFDRADIEHAVGCLQRHFGRTAHPPREEAPACRP
jgi:hypothetical protein